MMVHVYMKESAKPFQCLQNEIMQAQYWLLK